MFWKFFELLIRLVYFKRFRQADKIGKAAQRAAAGEPEEALEALEELAPTLHPMVAGLYGLTASRILSSLGRLEAAEEALVQAAKADPSNHRVHLDLAVVAGRLFRFDDARARLSKLTETADDDTLTEARDILTLIDQVVSGEREKELVARAEALAGRSIGAGGETAGIPADLPLIDSWITRDREAALEAADEIALLIGQSAAVERGAAWKVSLSLEESAMVAPDGRRLNPFTAVARRFEEGGDLSVLVDAGWS